MKKNPIFYNTYGATLQVQSKRQRAAVWFRFGRHSMAPTTSNRLTLKLVFESHLRWGTFVPNLGMPAC